MKNRSHNRIQSVRSHRGGAMINAVVFCAIISLVLAGIAKVSVSHYSRATVEANYVSALYLAEAGINYEIQKITANSTNADQKSANNPYGPTQTLGNGTFQVFCSNADGTTPWTTGSTSVVITSRGVCNGVSRQIAIMSQISGTTPPRWQPGPGTPPSGPPPTHPSPTPGTGSGTYVLYGADTTESSTIGGSPNISSGNIGLNHPLDIRGNPGIPGTITFNGSSAGWGCAGGGSGYTTKTNASAVTWATVDTVANGCFPSGGLTWLSTHNDNSLAGLASTAVSLKGNGHLTLVGKAGGANYYLTSLDCAGNSDISFDNTNGPIYIWFGPSRGSGTINVRGGNTSIAMSSDPAKGVYIYNALNSPFTIIGNATLQAGLYCVMGSASNNNVQFQGNGTFIGTAITDSFLIQGNPTLTFQGGYFTTSGSVTYECNGTWYDLFKVNE